MLKTSISIPNGSSHTFAPFTDSFMNAAHATPESVTISVQAHHGSLLIESMLHCFRDLAVTSILIGAVRPLDDHRISKMNSKVSHAKMPLKSTAVVIFKFHKVGY